jgi:hypothetical protein
MVGQQPLDINSSNSSRWTVTVQTVTVQTIMVGQQPLDSNSTMSRQQRLDSNGWTVTVQTATVGQ